MVAQEAIFSASNQALPICFTTGSLCILSLSLLFENLSYLLVYIRTLSWRSKSSTAYPNLLFQTCLSTLTIIIPLFQQAAFLIIQYAFLDLTSKPKLIPFS